MKFFFGPGNNSLSHITKCLSIMDIISSRGHEVFIAVAQKYSKFIKKTGYKYFILPGIQDDDSGFPSIRWFHNPEKIVHCIRAEVKLLEQLKPDRVLGVFSFTLKISAGIAGVPYDSLICGCMLKDSEDVLGFHGNEPDLTSQQINMETFFYYATQKMNGALKCLTPNKIDDIRDLFEGERTFLWDFPEFMPVPLKKNFIHLGPISYKKWETDPRGTNFLQNNKEPLAVISFGTCSGKQDVVRRLARICIEAGFKVLVAAGGQKKYLNLVQEGSKIAAHLFADLDAALSAATLLITHGGQLNVFEALQKKVPVMVMPFQPEQAHNGICLERIGCGKLLIAPRPFRTGPDVYIDAFDRMEDGEIKSKLDSLCNNFEVASNLAKISGVLNKYKGADTLASMMEEV
ncbi:MAG: glycosyl transferase [Desulfobacteraceae bacterium]|nr:glycosyl transferase [Desulfobacteraceae bacterium]